MNIPQRSHTDFDSEQKMAILKVKLYTDGGSRGNDKGDGSGKGAGAWIVMDDNDAIIAKGTEYYGIVTNNEAEYLSLIRGFELILKYHPAKIECYSDSMLMINQMRGLYKIKKDNLKKLAIEAKKLESQFKQVTYFQVPRTNPMIRSVDRMLNKTMDENITQ